jgi:aflatoxin B1 aldehyde reductase
MAHEWESPRNRIILGVMNIGPDVSEGARITSLDEYNAILDYLQAKGYNEIDTSRMYQRGKQEEFTGAAHWKARGLKVSTKVCQIHLYSFSVASQLDGLAKKRWLMT